MTIFPGAKIRFAKGQREFSIGAIARNKHGERFALCIPNSPRPGPLPAVLLSSNGSKIGHLSEDPSIDIEPMPLYAIISRVILRDDIDTATGRNVLWPRAATSTEELLGEKVFKVNDQECKGEIVGTFGMVSIAANNTFTKYCDAVEIRFDADDAVRAGDSGLLIISTNGSAVGLMSAGDGGTCFVAPLRPYLEKHGLELWAPHDAQWSDLTLATDKFEKTVIDDATNFDLGPIPNEGL